VNVCASCGAPARPFWPPSTRQPVFEKRATQNWLTLSECATCGQLWTGVPYEPYASFIYLVPWYRSAADWLMLAEQDHGRSVVEWAESRIRATWQQLGSADQAAIEHHRQRSYGRNPIDSSEISPSASGK
jgi:hypothetical protein